jgi:hypothetical protein
MLKGGKTPVAAAVPAVFYRSHLPPTGLPLQRHGRAIPCMIGFAVHRLRVEVDQLLC